MKKIISCFLVVAIFLSLFTMVTFAEVLPPNVVADYHFTTSTHGWTVFGSSGNLIHKDGYIGVNNEGKSWISPSKDIYDVIKTEGAGTYVINARVYLGFDPGHEVTARMLMRGDRAYSFLSDHNGENYGGIGVITYCEPQTWTNISGSIKVLESDISNETGDFILCFDSFFDLEAYNVYVDNVTVCKLYEDDVTNGDFSWNEIGWRNWGGKGNFTVEYRYEEQLFGYAFQAYYLKASTYGSIVTNVDQIIAKHGSTKYKLKFKIKVEEDYLENLDKIRFFLARNNGDYNYWIGAANATTLEDGNWVTIEKTIDMSTLVDGNNTLYDKLAPYQNQVFLRFDYVDAAGSTYDEEHSYYITDVSFKPIITAERIVLEKTSMVVEMGWDGNNPATVYPTNTTDKALYWSSSNSNVATVERNTGFIVARSAGTAVITAHMVNGTQKASFVIKVKDSVLIRHDSDGFCEVVLSSGKIWKCIDDDVVFYDQYGTNPAGDVEHQRRMSRCAYNYYEVYNSPNEKYGQKEYTDAELKLLYIIDPYGVAKYIQSYAANTYDDVKDQVQYKDRMFRLLFHRNPKYFGRTYEGEWFETSGQYNINQILSESEMYFGIHQIYDMRTISEIVSFCAAILNIAFSCSFFKLHIIKTIKDVVQAGMLISAGVEAILKKEFAEYAVGGIAGEIIEKKIKNVRVNWAYNFVSLYSAFQDLSNAIVIDLDYNKEIFNYCAYDNELSVNFEMQDGTIHNLKDVCELIN